MGFKTTLTQAKAMYMLLDFHNAKIRNVQCILIDDNQTELVVSGYNKIIAKFHSPYSTLQRSTNLLPKPNRHLVLTNFLINMLKNITVSLLA